MPNLHRPLCSVLALVFVACSGSDDEGESQTTSDDPNAFITKEEAAAAQAQETQETQGSTDTLIAPEVPLAGIDGSGVVVAEDDSTSWVIPNDGASFTGPPLQAGEGPANAEECPSQDAVTSTTMSVGEQICFYAADDPETPAARIDQVIESVEGEDFVRIRLTLSPNFVDNSYGETAVGWGEDEMPATDEVPVTDEMPIAGEMPMEGMADKMPKAPKMPKGAKGHTFEDLVGSDHAEFQITDANGNVVLHFKVDYLSEDATAPSGYSSLGVSGGEGALITGDPAWILEATSSMDRNFNACGYAEYTENSPVPPDLDTPGEAEDWDYRVVYEVWVSLDAFADVGFGAASIEFVHASPSKASSNTVDVTPGPCPPDEAPPDDEGAGGSGGSEGYAGSSAGGTTGGVIPEKAR